MKIKQLCLDLAHSDSEKEVVNLLKKAGLWNNPNAWRYYGDRENNFATIGNQQSRPEAAIVEKLINSVDAVLMAECMRRGVDPTSQSAPQSIPDALKKYFDVYNGKLSNITSAERSKLAQNISLVATGKKTNPSYSIIDCGEGQTPKMMPETLLSLGKSNKLRIPFVQGKFNMGGTGVLQFCGKDNLQLIISKRHPEISQNGDGKRSSQWGFTVVRREDPTQDVRNSVYRYLAPDNKILTFDAASLQLLPGEYPNAYENHLKWGTFIKLYEYQMTGLKTNINLALHFRLSFLMPSIALPVRLYERRKGFSSPTQETTLSGLTVRLEEDKKENLEDEFNPPATSMLSVLGEKMKVSIFVFKRGVSETYKKGEGIVFVVNGQTHGYLSKRFFSRSSVRKGYLANSLLVLVDCTDIDGRAREDLFMNSRDRLRSGELRSQIERKLEEILRNHQGLKDLNTRRRREDIEGKLEDSKPLADIIETIIEKSPTLSKLFIQGVRLPNPFKTKGGKKAIDFEGKRYPTYFKLTKEYPFNSPKLSPINRRIRVQFKTDATNDYFNRDKDPGDFTLLANTKKLHDFSVNLWNGLATLNITLPLDVQVGDIIHLQSKVIDISRVEPIEDGFYTEVIAKAKKHSGKSGERKSPVSNEDGGDVDTNEYLDLPNVREVRQNEWEAFGFSQKSALDVIDSGEDGYDFYINMDNIYLVTEKKSNLKVTPSLLDARYKYGMVLLGIALLKDANDSNTNKQNIDNEKRNVYEEIKSLTRVIAPILLPMISGLGELSENEIITNDDDDNDLD